MKNFITRIWPDLIWNVISILVALWAIWILVNAGYHVIDDACTKTPFPWLHSTEFVIFFVVAGVSTFGYLHSVNLGEPVQLPSSAGPTAAPATDGQKQNGWSLAVLAFGSLNLFCIARAANDAVRGEAFWQLIWLAGMYLLFCVFNCLVVTNGDDKSPGYIHNAFRWLREDNIISLSVFTLLALMTFITETLARKHDGMSKEFLFNFIAGASLFHVGASTVRYLYATMLEDDRNCSWLLTENGGVTLTRDRLEYRLRHDKAILVFITLFCATVVTLVIWPVLVPALIN